MSKIKLTHPTIEVNQALLNIKAVLNSGHLTSGPTVERFEQEIAAYTHTRHAVAVSNATVGIELVLKALNIGPGAEVIAPVYTHPGTILPILNVGAKPILLDVNVDRAQMLARDVKAHITSKTRAVIPVSLFGLPLNHIAWDAFKHEFPGLAIIEDGACSLGSTFLGTSHYWGELRHLDAVVLSFHPKKLITTGEGGMVLTRHRSLATELITLRNFGFQGTNAKMSDLAAAIGLAQVPYIDQYVLNRLRLATSYFKGLRDIAQVTLFDYYGGNFQSYIILAEKRDRLRSYLAPEIETQVGCFTLYPCDDYYGAEYLSKNALALPMSSHMSVLDVGRVTKKIGEFYHVDKQKSI